MRSSRDCRGDGRRHPSAEHASDKPTSAGSTLSLAWQASKLIAQDLRTTSEIVPLPPQQKDYYSYPEVTAPTFSKWRAAGAKMLVTGFVQARSDDRVTFGCYVYDVDKGREVGRKGFVVAPGEWSRAAHKCSGPRLHRGDRRARPVRHAHRLCGGERRGFGAREAHRDHG